MPLSERLKALMSSENSEWGTPEDFFKKLDAIFGFHLDSCATDVNNKTLAYISPEQDALDVEWGDPVLRDMLMQDYPGGMVVWMNPPYGKPEEPCPIPNEKCKKKKCRDRGFHLDVRIPGIGDWVSRAIEQTEKWDLLTVALLPARTDSEWFQQLFDKAVLICFVRGRIKFVGAKDTAPFPSVVAVFSTKELDDVVYEEMTEIGNVIDPREGQIMVYGGRR